MHEMLADLLPYAYVKKIKSYDVGAVQTLADEIGQVLPLVPITIRLRSACFPMNRSIPSKISSMV